MKLAEWVDHVETVPQGVTAGTAPNATLVRMQLNDVYPAACATINVFSRCSHVSYRVIHHKLLVRKGRRQMLPAHMYVCPRKLWRRK
jgi:hypothetical protein